MNAAKQTIAGDEVWNTIAGGKQIIVASNKKISEFDPQKDNKEEILAAVAGRTGNLRAPTLRIGAVYYVGYNDELYERIAALRS